MSDGQHKIDEDRQDYLDLCDRMGAKPRYTASSQPDCYGAHATELREKFRREGAPCYPTGSIPLYLGRPKTQHGPSVAHFTDYLTGYVQHRPDALDTLQTIKQLQWRECAADELRQRLFDLLKNLPAGIVVDIARGNIDPVEIVTQLREARDERQ